MSTQSYSSLPREVDCVVLGGGITGAGIARDAAMRGLSVLLVDSHDFASGTSHATSKLIHGGFRYLEQLRWRMVIDGVIERNRLLNELAPHLSKPIKFVLPFEGEKMPKWLAASAALHLYDLFGLFRCGGRSGATLGTTMRRDYPALRAHPFGIRIWDAQTNDVRLVLSTIRTAEMHGAIVSNYTLVKRAEPKATGWRLVLAREDSPFDEIVQARAIVNATGPWSSMTTQHLGGSGPPLTWLKGTHIVAKMPRAFGNDAIIFRSIRDKRPLWAIPWQNRLLIGTTESNYTGDPREIRPTSDEVDELLSSFHHWFPGYTIEADDLVSAFAGIRPIVAQEAAIENQLSREHEIETGVARSLITVRGGKLTTFRLMAEQVVTALLNLLDKPHSTESTMVAIRRSRLWPGKLARLDQPPVLSLIEELRRLSFADDSIDHLLKQYGTDAGKVLTIADECPELAARVSPDHPLTMAECLYLAENEHVKHLTDLMLRRTSLYLLLGNDCLRAIQNLLPHLAASLGWSSARLNLECTELMGELKSDLAAFDHLKQSSAKARHVG